MTKIGFLGGTFDPVHYGHLALGRGVAGKLGLDTLYFVPAPSPPHKSGQLITDFHHRVAMLRLAITDDSCLKVSEIEAERNGPSYTIDTLCQFRRQLGPGPDFFFVMGLDAFAEINTWKSYKKLLTTASFVVIDRPGHGPSSIEQVIDDFFPDYCKKGSGVWEAEGQRVICSFTMVPVPVSSTQVRERLRAGKSVRGLVPLEVGEYIEKQKLYHL